MEMTTMNEFQAVKRLGGNRIGHYAVLWGDPAKRDLTGEFFTRRTADLDTLFRAVGRLPLLYQHTLDDQLKTSVVGLVDVLSPDDVGLWYEAQLTMAGEYRAAMEELIGAGALGTSSGTLPGARRVDRRTGEIKRWAIAELSLTPTPAEPRMMERPAAEIKAAWKAAGLSLTPALSQWERETEGEKAANMADWLESRLHQTWTVLADDLFGDGKLARPERIALSGLIGDALETFHAGLQDEVLAGLRVRSPWDDAPSPLASLPQGEGDDDEDVAPDEEPDRGAGNARSAKDGRADSSGGSVGRPAKAEDGDAGGSRYAGGTGYSTGEGNGDAGNGPAREIDVELERVALLEV